MEHLIILGLNEKETFALLLVFCCIAGGFYKFFLMYRASKRLKFATEASTGVGKDLSDGDEQSFFNLSDMAGAGGHDLKSCSGIVDENTNETDASLVAETPAENSVIVATDEDFNSDLQAKVGDLTEEDKKASPEVIVQIVDSLQSKAINPVSAPVVLSRHEKAHKKLASASEKVVGSYLVYSNEELKKLLVEFRSLERKMAETGLSDDEKRQHNRLCNILTLGGVDLNPNIIG